MADKVIYFPYIRVPQNNWFVQVLLYWDQVGSIVPSDYAHNPEKLGSYMEELIKTGLVKPIIPGMYIHKIPNFTEAFINLLETNNEIRNRYFSIDKCEISLIHMEKLGDIARELCERGLAKVDKYPWYKVEKRTADLFMAYLASVLGKLEDLNMMPTTDQLDSLYVFNNSLENISDLNISIQQLRGIILEEILPAPIGEITLEKLAKFKFRYSKLLCGFRNYIENELNRIILIPNKELKLKEISLFKEKSKEKIEEIKTCMRKRNWEIGCGSLLGLAASAIPVIDDIVKGELTGVLKALPGLINAIYVALKGMREQNKILNLPLAYAVLVQKKLRR